MRAPQERSSGLDAPVARGRKWRFEVAGITFTRLFDAERFAYFERLRRPNEQPPKIFCRLARITKRDYP